MANITKNLLITATTLLLIVIVIVITRIPVKSGPDCSKKLGSQHTIKIHNNVVIPSTINANQCDILKIVNADDTKRIMAFGQHDKHITYDAIGETILSKDQSLKIVLSTKGTFLFHDHDNKDIKGTFTVK